MGILTNDMERLRREIGVLRGARKSLIKDLARGTREMKAAVAVMQAGFRDAHAEMAGNTRAERVAFVSCLRSMVCGMRKEFADDLAGARQVWSGAIPDVGIALESSGQGMEEFQVELGIEEFETQSAEAAGQETEARTLEEETEARTLEEETEHAGAGIEEEIKEEWTVPLKPKPKGKKKKY
jgi:hypothetical protein